MFNWFRRIILYVVKSSNLYQEEVERRISIERENYELLDRLEEAERELQETTLELEIQREEREKAHNLVGLVKSAKAELERRIERYMPAEVIYNMIETTDQPCLFLTSDLAILKGNKASENDRFFKNIPFGRSLLELGLIDEEEILLLREKAIASTEPFEYQSRNLRLKSWSIIPAKENDKVFGYVLTKKGFLTRTLERVHELYKELVGKEQADRIIQTASLSVQQGYS